jgi:hypothetical protein
MRDNMITLAAARERGLIVDHPAHPRGEGSPRYGRWGDGWPRCSSRGSYST